MQDLIARQARDASGRVRTRLVLDVAGRVIGDSTTVLSSDNVQLTNGLAAFEASCRYAPGRIAGVPVRTAVESGTAITVVSGFPP